MTTALHGSRLFVTPRGKIVILVVAFLGWFCSGMHMSITQLAGQPAILNLLCRTGTIDGRLFRSLSERAGSQGNVKAQDSAIPLTTAERQQLDQSKTLVAKWFAWFQCAFLFGAAAGGFLFGTLGDRFGRARAMSLSILTYSALAGLCCLAQSPSQLLMLWFLACTGTGGMWPNGVALVSEAWSEWSRPLIAGVIGTSANIGLFLVASLAAWKSVTSDDWRWLMLIGSAPVVLGVFAWFAVPESPSWLVLRLDSASVPARGAIPASRIILSEVFRPPLLRVTLIGITLATIPLMGSWGSANWMIPWAAEAGESADVPDPFLKARVAQTRAFTGIVGSLAGGWLAGIIGRRRSFLLMCFSALAMSQYIFWCLVPTDRSFLNWVAMLGLVNGLFFGWLPLFLPELFPTRVRSTGAGVSFNFGRILTAMTIFATGSLMQVFGGDYARIGRVTSLIFALGMIAVWFAPDTTSFAPDTTRRKVAD